jgi:acyl CoA:acetate/3-ketoacid CoA transferase alpha subunit
MNKIVGSAQEAVSDIFDGAIIMVVGAACVAFPKIYPQ